MVLLAAGFLFFLGVRAALADGGLGGITDQVLDSGQTDDSDSGVLDEVVEPVTDLVTSDTEETDDEPDNDNNETPSADSEAVDSKQPDPAPTQDVAASSQAEDTKDSASAHSDDDMAEPGNGDDGTDSQTTASGSQEQPQDEPIQEEGLIETVVDVANTVASDLEPTNSVDTDLTEVSHTVSTTTETTENESVTGQVVDAADDTTAVVSGVADVVSGATQIVEQAGSTVADISEIADVSGSSAVAEVTDLGAEIVGGVTSPLDNTLNAVSSDLEQVGGLLDVTLESVATSVDEVTSFTSATGDELLTTTADLVETATKDVEVSLDGWLPTEPSVEVTAREVIDESSVVTETSQRPPPPVVPGFLYPSPSATNQPEAGAGISSHGLEEGEARSMPPSIPSVDEVLALRWSRLAADGGFDHRADWTMSSRDTSATLTSTTGQVFGFFVVLAAMGRLALRMSRWLRLLPVLWRRYALAAAIDRPG